MIAVQDSAVAERLRRLRAHGMDVSDLARHTATDVVIETYPERGFNFRMTDMQAALGLCQLQELDWILERRRRLAERYTEALEGIPHLEAPYEPPYAHADVAVLLRARRVPALRRSHRADAEPAARRHRHAPRGDGDPRGGGLRRRAQASTGAQPCPTPRRRRARR